jgi:hypothetical protein
MLKAMDAGLYLYVDGCGTAAALFLVARRPSLMIGEEAESTCPALPCVDAAVPAGRGNRSPPPPLLSLSLKGQTSAGRAPEIP